LSGGVENLIIATDGQSTATIAQQIGRGVRHNSRGKTRVFGLFLLYNKYLYKHSRFALRAMVSMGYPARVVFPGGQVIDGQRFIDSRFHRPKNNPKH
jgi:hypothetical protein